MPAARDQVLMTEGACYAMWTGEDPEGSAMVLPVEHRPTVFDLTLEEWDDTRRLLRQLREVIASRYGPDGWNVGWNVDPVGGQSIPHAHCHLVPRYEDEPYANRGIRWWIKSGENRRPYGP